jgi:hypothetical protein
MFTRILSFVYPSKIHINLIYVIVKENYRVFSARKGLMGRLRNPNEKKNVTAKVLI